MAQNVVCLRNVPCAFEKNVFYIQQYIFCLLLGRVFCYVIMLHKCQLRKVGKVVQVFSVLPDFLFCQLIIERGGTISVDLSISPSSSNNFCFHVFCSIVIKYIESLELYCPLDELTLYHCKVTFLSLVIIVYFEIYFGKY